MEHKITVCASSGAWGIQSIQIYIDLGTPGGREEERKTLEEIRKEIMNRSCMAGYPSILHYSKIDDYESAVTFLRLDSQPLADEYIKRLNIIARCKKELAERAEELAEHEKKYPEHSRKAFLESTIKDAEAFMNYAKRAYELIGLDVNDTEKKQRICTNLGLYRTNL